MIYFMENRRVIRTILLNESALRQRELLSSSLQANVVTDDCSVEIRGSEIVFTCNSINSALVEEKILSIVSKMEIDPEAYWAYLGECGYYIPFTQRVNSEIEKFYIEEAKIIDPGYQPFSRRLQVSADTNNVVEFDKLGGFHIMLKNDKIYPIKRFANHERFDIELAEVVWQWKNDHENFIDYEDDINYLIEISYKRWIVDSSKKSLFIPSYTGRSYKISFKSLEQKSLMYNSRRKIRRQI